ncbi:MAG: glycosyltransferase family 39 protein [Alphaproteobacteria bacterium]|nr:MAG: glycosyltransferase family 39 protein [Alphaproteobacteria bacterium]
MTIAKAWYVNESEGLSWRGWAAVVLVALALFLPGLSALPPIDRDEARFMQASRQMIETHRYDDIRFLDEPRHNKPPGIYWLQSAFVNAAVATGLAGPHLEETWPYRLPSLLGALLGVVLTVLLGVRLFGARAGFLAGLIFAASVLPIMEAHLAKTDSALLACVLAAQLALARLYRGEKASWPLALLFWLAMAAGVVIKGPVIVMILGLTLLALGLSERRWAWMRGLRPVVGITLLAALTVPWVLMMHANSAGGFLKSSMTEDFLAKLTQPGGWGMGVPGFHLALSWFVFWPMSLLLWLAVPWVWARRREPSVRFCLAWALPSWLVFELTATKLAHYTLPLYPALAVLAGAAAVEGWRWAKPRLSEKAWNGAVLALWGGASLTIAAAMVLVTYLMQGHQMLLPQILTGLVALMASLAAAILAMRQRAVAAVLSLTLASLVMWPLWLGVALPRLDMLWVAPRVAELVARQPTCPGSMVVSSGKSFAEPSLAFALDGRVRMADSVAQAADIFTSFPCALALVPVEDVEAFRLATQSRAGMMPEQVGQVSGFNYGRGKPVSLTLWRRPHEEVP